MVPPTRKASRSPMPKWPASTSNRPVSMVNGTTLSGQDGQTDEAVILAQALSPIEPAWAKVKSYLRRVAARTVEALQQALAPALDSITAQDAVSFFRHCGYACPN